MISRIGFEALPPALRRRLAARVDRLGYLGDFFQVAAHQPEPLCHFFDFTEALKSALDPRLVSVIALTAASRTENEYERVQHERLALKQGMPEHEVRALVADAPLSAGFSAVEQLAARLTVELVDSPRSGSPDTFARLVREAGEAVAVACTMTAARYLAHAAMSSTWQLQAPVPSPLVVGVGDG